MRKFKGSIRLFKQKNYHLRDLDDEQIESLLHFQLFNISYNLNKMFKIIVKVMNIRKFINLILKNA